METTHSFAAFEGPATAFRPVAPPVTTQRPVNDRRWSARARLGFVLSSAILAWVTVIALGVEAIRLIGHIIH